MPQARRLAGYGFLLFGGLVLIILGAQGKVGAGLATVVAPNALRSPQASASSSSSSSSNQQQTSISIQ